MLEMFIKNPLQCLIVADFFLIGKKGPETYFASSPRFYEK